MARETRVSVDHLVAPLFVKRGSGIREPIGSMPGCHRLSIDALVEEAEELHALGIPAIALFPVIPDEKKDARASAATDPEGLYPRAVRALKKHVPDVMIITDTALDPYSSDGHDGIVVEGEIINDATISVMTDIAVLHAEAGADIIAPSDMMDGRVGAIRRTLDENAFEHVTILSYTAKYASSFYGPFRDALDSAPRSNREIPADKSTYQMNPANAEEAIREAELDLEEGADIIMVKPAHAYLDVIYRLQRISHVPIAAYHVSGEYAMLKAAAANGWIDEKIAAIETLTAIRRAGADLILTYFAKDAARWLQQDR
jgi:porphobilinogen synthase